MNFGMEPIGPSLAVIPQCHGTTAPDRSLVVPMDLSDVSPKRSQGAGKIASGPLTAR